MTIRIKSLVNGFRRCAIQHPNVMVEYPDNKFTPDEIKTLKAEPMLIVETLTKKDIQKEEQELNKEQDLKDKEAALKDLEKNLKAREKEIEAREKEVLAK